MIPKMAMVFTSLCFGIMIYLDASIATDQSLYSDVFKDCETDPNGLSYCIGFMEDTTEIVLCRTDITPCENDKIILKVEITAGSDIVNLHIVGGYKYGWMALAFSKRFGNIMNSGSPAIVAISELQQKNTIIGHLGTNNIKNPSAFLVSPKPFALLPNATIIANWIEMKFPLGPSDTLQILNSKDRIIINEPNYIILAQGDLDYESNYPKKHLDEDRGKSRYKFNLAEVFGGVEARVYRHCGTDAYCFGIGKDGCGRGSFDCELLIRIHKPKDQAATFLLQGKFDGTIALGISETPRIDEAYRWKHLNHIVECKPGTGVLTAYTVSGCRQNNYGSCNFAVNPTFPITLSNIRDVPPASEKYPSSTHSEWTQCQFEISHADIVTTFGLGVPHNLLLLGRFKKGDGSLANYELPPNPTNLDHYEITNFTSVYLDFLPNGEPNSTFENFFTFENFLVKSVKDTSGRDPFILNPIKPSKAHTIDYNSIHKLILFNLGSLILLMMLLE